jgi:hypothetical protein
MRALFIVPALVGLAACAASYREPELPADHPANPSAESSAPSEHSRTLAIEEPGPASPVTTPGGHQGHGADQSPQPAAHEHGAIPAPGESVPAAVYACPMHPEVTSDKPNQRCPKCGMKLTRIERGGKQP